MWLAFVVILSLGCFKTLIFSCLFSFAVSACAIHVSRFYHFTPVTSEHKVCNNNSTKKAHNCSIERRNQSEKVAPAEIVARLEVE